MPTSSVRYYLDKSFLKESQNSGVVIRAPPDTGPLCGRRRAPIEFGLDPDEVVAQPAGRFADRPVEASAISLMVSASNGPRGL
jgi:hypothetical protein